MPYKDNKQANEASKERMRKHRQGVTKQGVTLEGVTLLKRPNGPDYNPDEKLPDGSLRYMGPFSDGQVLDKTTVPIIDTRKIPGYTLQCLKAMVNAEFKPCSGRDPKRLKVELDRYIPA